MKTNVFKEAKFGDKFKSRDGRKFCFLGKIKPVFGRSQYANQLLEENGDVMVYYNNYGKSLYCEYSGSAINASYVDFKQVNSKDDSEDDIVSRY